MTMEDPAAAGRNCGVDHFQDQDSLLVKSAASAAREEATVFGAATVAIELRVDGARIWLVSHVMCKRPAHWHILKLAVRGVA